MKYIPIILITFLCLHLPSAEYFVIDLKSGLTRGEELTSEELTANDEYKKSELVMKLIPSGSFIMGSHPKENWRSPMLNEETQHEVVLSSDFYIGIFEITQGQFELLMGYNPSYFADAGASAPVDSVTWYQARGGVWPGGDPENDSFVGKLRSLTKLSFDLPTEAQWEYACRAGTTTATYVGDLKTNSVSSLRKIAWFREDRSNSMNGTHPVGLKMPNNWGLYDMYGNVYEWCLDRRGSFNSKKAYDPTGAEYFAEPIREHPDVRVIRGADWHTLQGGCRSAHRGIGDADVINGWSKGIGFRVVINLTDRGQTDRGPDRSGSGSREGLRMLDRSGSRLWQWTKDAL